MDNHSRFRAPNKMGLANLSGIDALRYYEKDNKRVVVLEEYDGSVHNSFVLYSLACLYLRGPWLPNRVSEVWKVRASKCRLLSQQLQRCRDPIHELLKLQAELEMFYKEFASGRLAEDFEAPFEKIAHPLYELREAIDQFLGWSSKFGRKVPKTDSQYVLYLMIGAFRNAKKDRTRVFSGKIAGIINEIAVYLGIEKEVTADTVLDAYKRFRKNHREFAKRIDADPLKYVHRHIRLMTRPQAAPAPSGALKAGCST